MKAIILAAGRGRRMKNVTEDMPKCMIKVRGKRLIDWQIESMRKNHVSEIAVVTGYLSELFDKMKLVSFHNARWSETNMVRSLCCAEQWLKSDTCLVSYSDIFYEATAVESLINCDADIAITYDVNWEKLWSERFRDPLKDAETFRVTSECFLSEIGNKPSVSADVQGQYMGLLKFSPGGWHEFRCVLSEHDEQSIDKMQMTWMLQKIVQAGRVPVHAVAYKGEWGELDEPSDLNVYR